MRYRQGFVSRYQAVSKFKGKIMIQWRYYGYGGGVELHEVYRCPLNEKPLWLQPAEEVEIALPDSQWSKLKSLKKLQASNLSGWFNEDDEIDEATAIAILQKWKEDGWPS